MSVTVKDVYWLAGILEGEGCFIATSYPEHRKGVFTGYPVRQVRISVEMCDRDIIERIKNITGTTAKVTLRNSRPNRNHRPRYTIHLSGTRAAQWAYTIYPLMGDRRKVAIQKLINLWKDSRGNFKRHFSRFDSPSHAGNA